MRKIKALSKKEVITMSVDKEKVVKYLKKNVGKEKSTKEIITESGALNIDTWPDNLIMFDL